MKALVLITHQDEAIVQYQFDQVMGLIAYDLQVSVVFMNLGCHQILNNSAWKCLNIYGVDDVFVLNADKIQIEKALFEVSHVNNKKLKQLIRQADVIL